MWRGGGGGRGGGGCALGDTILCNPGGEGWAAARAKLSPAPDAVEPTASYQLLAS